MLMSQRWLQDLAQAALLSGSPAMAQALRKVLQGLHEHKVRPLHTATLSSCSASKGLQLSGSIRTRSLFAAGAAGPAHARAVCGAEVY